MGEGNNLGGWKNQELDDGGGGGERNHATSDGGQCDKIQLVSSGQKQHTVLP